jgi:hypothetical protein
VEKKVRQAFSRHAGTRQEREAIRVAGRKASRTLLHDAGYVKDHYYPTSETMRTQAERFDAVTFEWATAGLGPTTFARIVQVAKLARNRPGG